MHSADYARVIYYYYMINQELIEYVKHQLESGLDEGGVRAILTQNGWQPADVEEVMRAVGSPGPVVPNLMRTAAPAVQNLGGTSHVGKRIVTVLLVLVVGAGVVAGGAWAYMRLYPSPASVLKSMLANISTVKSLEYSADVTFTVTDKETLDGIKTMIPGGQGVTGVQLVARGSSDATDLNNPKGTFVLDFLTIPAVKDLVLKLEARAIDKALYVRLGAVPNLGFFDASSFKGQWIKIKSDTVQKQLGGTGIVVSSSSQAQQSSKKLTPAQTEKIRAAINDFSLFVVTKEFPRTKVDGAESFHYALALDKKGLKDLAHEIAGIISEDKTLTADETKQITAAEENFGKEVDKTDIPSFELWVGTGDMLPRKLSFEGAIAPNDPTTGAPRELGKVALTMSFKNFNKPVMVDAPSGAKDIEEILGPLMMGMMGGGGPGIAVAPSPSGEISSRDQRRLANIREIQAALELYQNKCAVYPNAKSGGTSNCPKMKDTSWNSLATVLTGAGLGIKFLPNEPMGGQYYYGVSSDGSGYMLGAELENKNQPAMTQTIREDKYGVPCKTKNLYCVAL